MRRIGRTEARLARDCHGRGRARFLQYVCPAVVKREANRFMGSLAQLAEPDDPIRYGYQYSLPLSGGGAKARPPGPAGRSSDAARGILLASSLGSLVWFLILSALL